MLWLVQTPDRRMSTPLRHAPSLPRGGDDLVELSQDVQLSISQDLQSVVPSGGCRAQPPCGSPSPGSLSLPRRATTYS